MTSSQPIELGNQCSKEKEIDNVFQLETEGRKAKLIGLEKELTKYEQNHFILGNEYIGWVSFNSTLDNTNVVFKATNFMISGAVLTRRTEVSTFNQSSRHVIFKFKSRQFNQEKIWIGDKEEWWYGKQGAVCRIPAIDSEFPLWPYEIRAQEIIVV